MELINRGVVVIKPKQPFLDWLQRDPTMPSLVTLEYLRAECLTFLVPDLDHDEAVLNYLNPLKPLLFEMELAGWNRDPTTWPEERTAEVFDVWFEIEVHSMVYDLVNAPVKKEDEEVVDLGGTWFVIASPDFDDDYLHMETRAYVALEHSGVQVSGKFQIGLIVGSLDGQWVSGQVLFSFGAFDEMDPVNGWGVITAQGTRMIFQLMFHLGDNFAFECERSKA